MSQNDPLLGSDWLEKEEPISGQSIHTTNGIQFNAINGQIVNKTKTQLNTTQQQLIRDPTFGSINSHLNNSNQLLNNYNSNRFKDSKQLMSAIAMSSSDSSTDDIVIPMQRRKVKTRFTRKRRSRSTDSNLSIKSRALISCPSICLKIVLILMIVSSIAFTILFIAKLYDRIDSLQTAINDLRISGNIVPEEMHSIHSHLKTLDSNMSSVKTNLSHMFDTIDNLTQEVKQIKLQMTKLSDSVEAAPAIRQLPKELQELQKVVAEMGSRLTTNDNEVKSVKVKQSAQQLTSDSLHAELSLIHSNVSELYSIAEHNNSYISSAKLEQNTNQLNQLSDNLNKLQMVYTGLVNWKAQVDEQIKAVLQLTQQLHEIQYNNSLTDRTSQTTGAKHESHNTESDHNINNESTIVSVSNQTTLS